MFSIFCKNRGEGGTPPKWVICGKVRVLMRSPYGRHRVQGTYSSLPWNVETFPTMTTYIDLTMSTVALSAVNLMEREGAEIARGLRRRDSDRLDHLIEVYQHRLLRYLIYLTG